MIESTQLLPHKKARPTIGFLIDAILSGYQASVWNGALDAAKELDVNLLCVVGGILHSPDHFDSHRNATYALTSIGVASRR